MRSCLHVFITDVSCIPGGWLMYLEKWSLVSHSFSQSSCWTKKGLIFPCSTPRNLITICFCFKTNPPIPPQHFPSCWHICSSQSYFATLSDLPGSPLSQCFSRGDSLRTWSQYMAKHKRFLPVAAIRGKGKREQGLCHSLSSTEEHHAEWSSRSFWAPETTPDQSQTSELSN